MDWKHLTKSFLLCSSLSFAGSGCAAFNAMVSSPAGHGAHSASPERLTAIGRVFENQGQLAHAEAMYRRALAADPKNRIARERVEFIASLRQEKTFDSKTAAAQQAIAAADAVKPPVPRTPEIPKAVSTPPTATPNASVASALSNDSVIQSLTPITVTAHTVTARKEPEARKAAVALAVNAVETTVQETVEEAVELDLGELNDFVQVKPSEKVEPLVQESLKEVSDARPELDSLEPIEIVEISDDASEPEEAAADVEIVAESADDTFAAATVMLDSPDDTNLEKSARILPLITLSQVLEWGDSPVRNQDNLISAIQFGEDEGVRSLAAIMTTECPLNSPEIDQALEAACNSDGSELLKVSARDALLQRGSLSGEGVTQLIGLLRSDDLNIRSQAAASLRNCTGTRWSSDCVRGLTDLLTDSDDRVVAVAASTLGDFGPAAVDSISELENVRASQTSPEVQEAAALALERIRGSSVSSSGRPLPPVLQGRASTGGQYLPVVQ
ncbi:MAG: HEAT repeat domain-containing protein [Planctomycetaceae bacterium]|nr:HEAT repeat domain-containing protein [Planctomycetaceae bacterium]